MELKKKHHVILFPRINKTIIVVFALAFIIAGLRAYQLFGYIFHENVKTPGTITIPKDATFDQVVDSLKKHDVLVNYKAFIWVSKRKDYIHSVKAGKYEFEKGKNTNQLVNMLKSGRQHPVKLTFNNIRFKEDLAGVVAKYIEPDSATILEAFNDSNLWKKYGFNKYTFPCMFIPNTYEFYWTTSAEQFLQRMSEEYRKFWDSTRVARAQALELTPEQVITIASIVQEETNKPEEKPIIAGLYLNRLKKGIPLQADPTVKFAFGDFTIRRVLNRHLEIDSPYNTYKYIGLPPGPINIPEISSIEAVLNAAKTPYIYMCAREDFSGYHNFARTLSEHNENARRYKEALDTNKIYQ
jgi:UPF0755 protein